MNRRGLNRPFASNQPAQPHHSHLVLAGPLGPVTINGVRAAATAAGREGSPLAAVTGGRALATAVTSDYKDLVLGDSPIAYWRLGELSGTVAVDGSGNGHNGAYQSSPTLGSASLLKGDSDPSVSFAGSGQCVTTYSYSCPTTISVEAIVQPANTTQGSKIVGKHSNTTDVQGSLGLSGGNAHFEITVGGVYHDLAGTSVLSTSQPSHVVGVYDGSFVRIYVNGIQESSFAMAGAIATNAIVAAIGALSQTFPASGNVVGSIDEVAIYSTALSAASVLAHYRAAAGAPGPVSVTVTGVRAAATAAGKAGTVSIGAANVSVTGVRALATAAGKAGSPNVTSTGVRAAATAAGRSPTSTLDTVSGVRAAATAAGRAGSPLVGVSVRAAATATAKTGSPKVAVTGVRALATAAGKAGTVSINDASGNVSVSGVRALATAAGKVGTGAVSVTGVRAAATAAGRVGSAKVAATGVRALATATGRPGSPLVAVTGVRGLATATGKVGTVRFDVAVTGARAATTATGRAGGLRLTASGARGLATATARPGAPLVAATGMRGLATATGKAGTIRFDTAVIGIRALAATAGRPGILIIGRPGDAQFTTATKAATGSSATHAIGADGATVTSTGAPAETTGRAYGSGPYGSGPYGGSRSGVITAESIVQTDPGITLAVVGNGRMRVLVG